MGKPPPIQPWMIFISVVALALGLHVLLPQPFPDYVWLPYAGWANFAIGAVLVVFGIKGFAKSFRSGGVWNPDHLVTTGIMQISRNPLYLGVALAILGVGLVRGHVWLMISGVLMLVLLDFLVIPFEEKMLEEKFGAAYRSYKKKVRRWL